MLPDGFVDRAEEGGKGRTARQLVQEMIQKSHQCCGEDAGHVLLRDVSFGVQVFNIHRNHAFLSFCFGTGSNERLPVYSKYMLTGQDI